MNKNIDSNKQNLLEYINLLLILTLYGIIFLMPPTREDMLRKYFVAASIKKVVEEHNKNNVLHQMHTDTITSYEFTAITDPCTAWDWRERGKCRRQNEIYMRSH